MPHPSRRAPGLLALVPLVALGLVATGGCSSDHTSATGSPAVVVGDSLSVLGADAITSALGRAGWQASIVATPGVTVGDQLPALTAAAARSDATTIVELGTNDARRIDDGELDADAVRADITRALDLFGDRCVVWVNADADPTRPGGSGGAVVDGALTAEARHRPNLHVADLAAVLVAHPDYLVDDQIHLTDAGSQALGRLMADTARACH